MMRARPSTLRLAAALIGGGALAGWGAVLLIIQQLAGVPVPPAAIGILMILGGLVILIALVRGER